MMLRSMYETFKLELLLALVGAVLVEADLCEVGAKSRPGPGRDGPAAPLPLRQITLKNKRYLFFAEVYPSNHPPIRNTLEPADRSATTGRAMSADMIAPT